MNSKIEYVEGNPDGVDQYQFYCPGCECHHSFWHKNIKDKVQWSWNKSFVKPTVTPSIKTQFYSYKFEKDMICHFYIKNGKIQYLNDCTHELAGETIKMVPIKEI